MSVLAYIGLVFVMISSSLLITYAFFLLIDTNDRVRRIEKTVRGAVK